MAVSLPYLATYKNLPLLFEKINAAKVPESGFTQNFLKTTIGLKSTNDRALIPLLRHLGFIDQSNIPTAAYRLLKGESRKRALADGIRRAYSTLFDADQAANKLSGEKLKSLVAQVAGTDADMTSRITGTFSSLVNLADFENPIMESAKKGEDEEEGDANQADEPETGKSKLKSLRTEFHYNIQIHLPSNGTEETYLHIFNAIRRTFQ